MVAALEAKLIATHAFYMTASFLLLYYTLAFPALTTVRRIIQHLEISALARVKDTKAVVAAKLLALLALQY